MTYGRYPLHSVSTNKQPDESLFPRVRNVLDTYSDYRFTGVDIHY